MAYCTYLVAQTYRMLHVHMERRALCNCRFDHKLNESAIVNVNTTSREMFRNVSILNLNAMCAYHVGNEASELCFGIIPCKLTSWATIVSLFLDLSISNEEYYCDYKKTL